MSVDWDNSKYFKATEFVCSHFLVGFTGIGVNQKGGARFLHLDTIESSPARPRPTIWSY